MDRNLIPGMTLVAAYKGQTHRAFVVLDDRGDLRIRLEDGRMFATPSAAGKAVTGKSCNGWVFWSNLGASQEAGDPSKTSEDVARPPKRERDLYPGVKRALEEGWIKERKFQDHLVQITGDQGSRATGGMWTRPDVTVIAMSKYAYVPDRFFDVITFEVKPEGTWHDLSGVFEAAAHSRIATRSYILFHCLEEGAIPEKQLKRLREECERFNVGLALFREPGSYGTYQFLVDPVRKQPNPEEMEEFIDSQMSIENKRLISRWR